MELFYIHSETNTSETKICFRRSEVSRKYRDAFIYWSLNTGSYIFLENKV